MRACVCSRARVDANEATFDRLLRDEFKKRLTYVTKYEFVVRELKNKAAVTRLTLVIAVRVIYAPVKEQLLR